MTVARDLYDLRPGLFFAHTIAWLSSVTKAMYIDTLTIMEQPTIINTSIDQLVYDNQG